MVSEMDKKEQPNHEICFKKKEWDELFKFKENMIGFKESKKVLNGVTRKDIEYLKQRIKEIDAKIDRLLFIFVTASITMIITTLFR